MKIGLIDADGHNGFPNLALMRISAWHKARGDDVQWWFGFDHYDIVYISKVFSAAYSDDAYTPPNADIVIRGGSGYAIRTISGVEIYDPAAWLVRIGIDCFYSWRSAVPVSILTRAWISSAWIPM